MEALKLSGHIVLNEAETSKEDKILSNDEQNVSELLGQNKLKIIAKYVTIQETLNEIIDDIKTKLKKGPSHELIAMYSDESPIFGFVVDEKLVSDIGYRVYYTTNKDGKSLQ